MKILPNLILLIAVTLATAASAQVSITLLPPNRFDAKVGDVFNAGIINSTGATTKIYMVATVKDKKDARQLLSAKTLPFDYANGYTQLNEAMAAPTYNYTDNVLAQTRLFSFGQYNLCMKAYSAVTNELLAEECTDFEVATLAPPLLLSPENGSEIRTRNPLLIWLPPTPADPRMGIVYDLKLVQIYPNQTPYDAIVRNPAIIEPHGLKLTNLQYPANAIALEDNVKYAWKVIARLPGGKVVGETEVWNFVKRPAADAGEAEEYPVKNYIEMKTVKDANYVVVKDEMKIVYQEKYGTIEVHIKITDAKGEEVHTEKATFNIGENRYVLNLEQIKSLKNNAYYILEISAKDRLPQYLMFKNLK